LSELLSIGTKAKSINAIKIAIEILNRRATKELLISLNTRNQLFDKGEDSRGIRLDQIGGSYSINTIEGVEGVYPGKKDLGLPFDRVTLYQTGEFYESFQIKIEWPFIIFIANDLKEGISLNEEWGGHILGLNEENKRFFESFLLEQVIDEILQRLLS